MSEELYKVRWTDKDDHDHEGEEATTKDLAVAWVEHENKKYPEIRHRIMKVVTEQEEDSPAPLGN